jgi:hypothetical protein
MAQDDFDRKIDAIVARQARHDEQIHGLIRIAELHQNQLARRDETVTSLAPSLIEIRDENTKRQKEMDARVDKLVGAIGQLIQRAPIDPKS